MPSFLNSHSCLSPQPFLQQNQTHLSFLSYLASEHHHVMLWTMSPFLNTLFLDFRNTYSSFFLLTSLASPQCPSCEAESLPCWLPTSWHRAWLCHMPSLFSCHLAQALGFGSHPCLQPRPRPWPPDLFVQWPLGYVTNTSRSTCSSPRTPCSSHSVNDTTILPVAEGRSMASFLTPSSYTHHNQSIQKSCCFSFIKISQLCLLLTMSTVQPQIISCLG